MTELNLSEAYFWNTWITTEKEYKEAYNLDDYELENKYKNTEYIYI